MDQRILPTFRFYLDELLSMPVIVRSVTSSRTRKNELATLRINNPEKGVQVWLTDSLDVVIFVLVDNRWKSLYRYRAEYSPTALAGLRARSTPLASGQPDPVGLTDGQFQALLKDSAKE